MTKQVTIGLALFALGGIQGCGTPGRDSSPKAAAKAGPEHPTPQALPDAAKPKISDSPAAAKPAPASAQAPKAAAPYEVLAEVTGVVAPDTLNLRAAPSAKAKILAKIPAKEKVKCLGPHELTKGSRWLQVRYQDKRGWVNQKHLKFRGPQKALAHPLECVGTEPFWSIQIDPSGLSTFEAMGESAQPLLVESMQAAVGHRQVWSIHFHSTSASAPSSGFLSKSGSCSDGMSDHQYAYDLFILLGSKTALKGCCDLSEKNLRSNLKD